MLSSGSLTCICSFMVMAEFPMCSPHDSFILTLYLENNNLVMLIILNFIPDRGSSNNCIWGSAHFFTV